MIAVWLVLVAWGVFSFALGMAVERSRWIGGPLEARRAWYQARRAGHPAGLNRRPGR